MYITLEKQYQFFKFLQESNYGSDLFNIEHLKRAWSILEKNAFKLQYKFMQANNFPESYIFETFLGFVNIQIEIYNKNTEIIKQTNNTLNRLCPVKDNGDRLTTYHNKKMGIKETIKDDFLYNKTNIGVITSCLANAIGNCMTHGLSGIEKIMDFKDCNIQIAKEIKAKYDINNGNNT